MQIRPGREAEEQAEQYAMDKVQRDFDQGWQGIEYKLNTVGSSQRRLSLCHSDHRTGHGAVLRKWLPFLFWNVHMGGQGRPGNKKPVLFPKIVFPV